MDDRGTPNVARLDIVRYITNKFGNKVKKSLGQNFLINEGSLNRILKVSDLQTGDIVLEIGPGIGVISYSICHIASFIYLIEIDKQKEPAIRKVLENFSNYELIINDATNYDYNKINKKVVEINKNQIEKNKKIKIISALPYNVAKKIIYSILLSNLEWTTFTAVLQKEVALKYSGLDKKNKFLGTFANIFAHAEYKFDVPQKHFYPIPKVTSSVIQFTKHNNYQNIEKKKLSSFIKQCYKQPRKTVSNNLKAANYDIKILANQPVLSMRPDNLDVNDWVDLYELLNNT